MTSQRMRILMIVPALVFVFVGGWILTYPDTSDPKNAEYVLWKVGLYKMNLDMATDTMIGDAHRDKLVVGKTEVQLRNKFGYLLTPNEASPYLRGCYQDSFWKDRTVLFIRKSPWMVVFNGDRAVDLVLIKGC